MTTRVLGLSLREINCGQSLCEVVCCGVGAGAVSDAEQQLELGTSLTCCELQVKLYNTDR